MDRSDLETHEQAVAFYRRVTDPTAKSILDFLIDHPEERHEGADLVQQLGLAEHRDVARSTYLMGQIASDQGLDRPWTEGQRGYLLPEEHATLLREARGRAAAG